MLEQLSIFAENAKGAMQRITAALQEEGINIAGSVTNDSAEYGIIRMVVSDSVKAEKALKDRGYLCKREDVLGIEIADEVGSMNKLLLALENSNVSADYFYLSFNRETSMPIMVFRTPDIYEVEQCLQAKGFTSVGK